MSHIVSRVGIGKQPPAAPLFLDVAGPANFDAAVSIIGQTTAFALVSAQLATNVPSFETRDTLNPEAFWYVRRDGLMAWGTGLVAQDVTLSRVAAATLGTNGSFNIAVNLLVQQNSQFDGDLILGATAAQSIAVNAQFTTSLLPQTTNTVNLGSTTLRWADLYTSNNTYLGIDDTTTINIQSQFVSDIIPATTNLHSVGSSALRWAAVYVSSTLNNSGNTILGDAVTDTITLNASITTDVLPTTTNSHNLGSNSLKWASLFLASNLNVDGSTTLGDTSADTVTFNALANSNFTPATTNTFDLGTSLLKWRDLNLSGDLNVDGTTTFTGDVVFGDANTDTVTFVSQIDSDLIPAIDNTYDIGTPALRWKTLHVGPGSLIVHNDAVDTEKIAVDFSGLVGRLIGSSIGRIQMTVDANEGLSVDSAGFVGINKSAALAAQLDVVGDIAATDTINANKATGTSLFVKNVAEVEGSIEAAAPGLLNIGVTSATNQVNVGTGSNTQVINLGTGAGQTIINIGAAGDIININGTAAISETINTSVQDKTFVLNAGGAASSANGTGLFVEEAAAATLPATDPTWQNTNIVRYLMASTGNIQVGSRVTVTGFANATNNGSFIAQNVASNVHIDLITTRIDATDDEVGSGSITNPTIVAGISVNATRDGWEIYSPLNLANTFTFVNLGQNVTLTADSNELLLSQVDAFAPSITGLNLGTVTKRWDIHGEHTFTQILDVIGNSTIGTTNANTLTVNSTAVFDVIGSDLLPDADAAYDLGSVTAQWKDLFLSGALNVSSISASSVTATTLLQSDGDTILGDANTDTLTINAVVDTSIIPTGTVNLGSGVAPWTNVFATNLYSTSINTDRVVLGGASGLLTSSANLTFTSGNLAVGPGAASAKLDVNTSTGSPTLRLYKGDTTNGFGLVTTATQTIVNYSDEILFQNTTAANLANNTAGSSAFKINSDGMFSSLSGFSLKYGTVVTANTYVVTVSDTIVPVDTSSTTADCVVTLPAATTPRILVIKDVGNNCSLFNRNILLTPASGEYVEFGAVNIAYVMDSDGMSITLHSNGSGRWFII